MVSYWVMIVTYDANLELPHSYCWIKRQEAVRNAFFGGSTSHLHLKRINEALTAAVHKSLAVPELGHGEFPIPLAQFCCF